MKLSLLRALPILGFLCNLPAAAIWLSALIPVISVWPVLFLRWGLPLWGQIVVLLVLPLVGLVLGAVGWIKSNHKNLSRLLVFLSIFDLTIALWAIKLTHW